MNGAPGARTSFVGTHPSPEKLEKAMDGAPTGCGESGFLACFAAGGTLLLALPLLLGNVRGVDKEVHQAGAFCFGGALLEELGGGLDGADFGGRAVVAARKLALDALFGAGIESNRHRGSIPPGWRATKKNWAGTVPSHI